MSRPSTALRELMQFEESFGSCKPGLVAKFVLPLELCPTTNATIGSHWSTVTKLRKRCHVRMLAAYFRRFNGPPPARLANPIPRRLVVCTRHSSTQPDAHANWSKIPVDVLSRRTAEHPKRLSLIWDDSPKHAQIEERWEKAPRGEGYCTIEVFE